MRPEAGKNDQAIDFAVSTVSKTRYSDNTQPEKANASP